MTLFFKLLAIFALLLLSACSKEKPAEPAAATPPEPAIFKSEIKTLHGAEDASKLTEDTITARKKEIDAATE